MSHPCIVQAAPEDPPRPSNQKILEEEQKRLYHAHDVFPICHQLMKIVQSGIDRGIFPNGSKVREFLDAIITEA